MKKLFVFLFIVFITGTVETRAQSQAEPTTVTVRALAKDAKFIGTSMGGAMIIIRNAETGEILAKGTTSGSTGDTRRLVMEPHERYGQLGTPGAAKFEAELDLMEPTFVTVEATAPYAKRQAHVVSSTQLWLIPGKDITGDGLILEIPGFTVDVLAPQTHSSHPAGELTIRANITMMCGCGTSDGGLWDSSEFEIRALVKRNGEQIGSVPLAFTGQSSTFEGTYTAEEAGAYEFVVYAYHAKTGNTGVDKTTTVISDQ